MSVLHKMSTYPQSIPPGPLSHTCHLSMFILCGAVRGFILRLSQTVLKHRNSIWIRLYRWETIIYIVPTEQIFSLHCSRLKFCFCSNLLNQIHKQNLMQNLNVRESSLAVLCPQSCCIFLSEDWRQRNYVYAYIVILYFSHIFLKTNDLFNAVKPISKFFNLISCPHFTVLYLCHQCPESKHHHWMHKDSIMVYLLKSLYNNFSFNTLKRYRTLRWIE